MVPLDANPIIVLTLAAHRLSALTVVSEVMDYPKTEAPIWKKEVGAVGARWVEPNAADRRAAASWSRN